MQRHLSIILALLCASCSGQKPAPAASDNPPASNSDFEKLTDDLLYGSLALSPVTATQMGYHEHNGVQLDEMIDDFSPSGIDVQRKFYQEFQTRVNAWNTSSLDKEQRADLEIMKNDLSLYLLDLNTIQSFNHNPTVYVELAG